MTRRVLAAASTAARTVIDAEPESKAAPVTVVRTRVLFPRFQLHLETLRAPVQSRNPDSARDCGFPAQAMTGSRSGSPSHDGGRRRRSGSGPAKTALSHECSAPDILE